MPNQRDKYYQYSYQQTIKSFGGDTQESQTLETNLNGQKDKYHYYIHTDPHGNIIEKHGKPVQQLSSLSHLPYFDSVQQDDSATTQDSDNRANNHLNNNHHKKKPLRQQLQELSNKSLWGIRPNHAQQTSTYESQEKLPVNYQEPEFANWKVRPQSYQQTNSDNNTRKRPQKLSTNDRDKLWTLKPTGQRRSNQVDSRRYGESANKWWGTPENHQRDWDVDSENQERVTLENHQHSWDSDVDSENQERVTLENQQHSWDSDVDSENQERVTLKPRQASAAKDLPEKSDEWSFNPFKWITW